MQGNARKLKDSKGFSLVELLVVMALIGVMVAIAMPSVVSQISHLRLTRSVRNVVSELNAARFKAIAKNNSYQVHFTTPTYQLKYNNAGSFVAEPGRAAGALENGITITSGADFFTTFSSNGTATGTTSICIENTASDRMRINITSTTGMIQVTTGC